MASPSTRRGQHHRSEATIGHLLLWTSLLLTAVLPTLGQDDSLVYQGENSCTRILRRCVDEAECVNQTCVCQGTGHGEGQFHCADEDEVICMAKADPHTWSYGLARGNIILPCRYRLSSFTTALSGGSSVGADTCRFEVMAFSMVSQSGKYFTAGVEISFAIGVGNGDTFQATDVIQYVINSGGIRATDGTTRSWGGDLDSVWNGINVRCRFEPLQHFAIFSVPSCGETKVRFRPYLERDEPGVQVRMPGISVTTRDSSQFDSDLSHYPKSLCGAPGDPDSLYDDRAKELGLISGHAAILHDLLEEGAIIGQKLFVERQTAFNLPTHIDCHRAIEQFQRCGENKVKAMNVCVKVVSTRRMVRCLRSDLLETFIACLDAMCNSGSSCFIFKANLRFAAKYNPLCYVPKRIRRSGICGFE